MDINSCERGKCKTPDGSMNRRTFLGRMWWGVAGLLAIESFGGFVASLWPRTKSGSFGGKISATTIDEARAMPIGTVMYFPDARFYLSRVDSGFVALYRRCTHVGCVVPWLPDDPSEDDLALKGRFNCPCHSSIFDRYGVVKAGPAPRPLDLFPISIEDGELIVDTGTVIERLEFDESQVIRI